MAARTWGRAGRSMSNMSRPTRPGRCTWAIAAARWSATRWRPLLEYAGHKVIREYYVNDAGAQVDILARSAHLRYLEALGRQIGEIPEGLYPGDYLKPVGAGARRRIWRALCRRARKRLAGDLPPPNGRGDARDHQGRSRHPRRPPRSVRLRARGAGIGRGRPRRGLLRAKGLVYEGVLEAPKGETPRRLGAGRAAPVPLDPVRRRPGPADQEVRRQLDLFRRRPRLSYAEARSLRRADRHLGRRPCRHGQADPGRGRR